MNRKPRSIARQTSEFPRVLSVGQRAEVVNRILGKRLDTVLPIAMRENGLDMWIVLCQQDDLDPAFTTLVPLDTSFPILQMLVFYDRGIEAGVERINISGTRTHDLYDKPYSGKVEEKQWSLLRQIVEDRDPKRIGINIGAIKWAAGGLTHNLYLQLLECLPAEYVQRLESAEGLVTRWLSTLTQDEIVIFEHVANVAHHLIAECYSHQALIPGITTTDDLRIYYWQRCMDLGLEMCFRPSFYLIRSNENIDLYGKDDTVIRPGDLVRCDAGIHYLRLCTDMQEWVYALRPGESDAPDGAKQLLAEGNRLQDVFMSEFKLGLTGNELLHNILTRARAEGIPNPRVYSHSLGIFSHEPGPLIGLPWEQERCPGRGDVKLEYTNSFTMELSITAPMPEWNGQEVRFGLEEDVVFTREGCRPINGRQTEFYLI